MKGRLPVYEHSFFAGTARPDGLGLTMMYEDGFVLCDIFADTRFEGYTDVLHGGMVFGIMDIMIWYAILMDAKKMGMTRRMETEFLKPVMCNTHYTGKARFLYTDEKDIHAEAWIENEEGETCAKVKAIFREARDIPPSRFLNRFDFSVTTPEIRDHILSMLGSDK